MPIKKVKLKPPTPTPIFRDGVCAYCICAYCKRRTKISRINGKCLLVDYRKIGKARQTTTWSKLLELCVALLPKLDAELAELVRDVRERKRTEL